MKIFKTPKGTELPILDLRGKDYLQVAHRLVWFRETHPEWSISTEFIQISDMHAIAKATILNEKGTIVATAHKSEDKKGFQDFIEKAETGAIGRALAACGYGTQFAPELDEHSRIVDSPVYRPRIAPQANKTQRAPSYQAPHKATPEGSGALTAKQLQLIHYIRDKNNIKEPDYIRIVKEVGGVDSDNKIPFAKVSDVLGALGGTNAGK